MVAIAAAHVQHASLDDSATRCSNLRDGALMRIGRSGTGICQCVSRCRVSVVLPRSLIIPMHVGCSACRRYTDSNTVYGKLMAGLSLLWSGPIRPMVKVTIT
jgi:hypothetical protein